MDVQDKRGIEGNLGLIGERGIVAEPLVLSPEEQGAQDALNQAAQAVVAARAALADAEKKFDQATRNADAVAAQAQAARIAQATKDVADASTAAAKAAADQANASQLAAQAAADKAAADAAQKNLDAKTAVVNATKQ